MGIVVEIVCLIQRAPRWSSAPCTVAMACVLAMPTRGFAQQAPAPRLAAPAIIAAPAKVASKPVASRPSWSELTPMQQQSLKPLALSWNTISEAQKRKWLEISKNYTALSLADQTTLHSRMNEWVALSPQQRAQARLNFAKTKELSTQLTPEEKKAKWQTYQALSPEEKQKLASNATPTPAGAAVAVKPVAPQKLTTAVPHGGKPDQKLPVKAAPNLTATQSRPASGSVPASPGSTPAN